MSLSAPKTPAAPDPAATSAAQTQSNQQTALYNFGLNNPNWNTPLGSLQYNVDTTNPNQPSSTANINLSPEQQQLFNYQNQQSIGLAQLANQLQGRIGDTLNQPLPTSGDINQLSKDAQDAYYNSQAAYLDPQYKQLESNQESKLANQGITLGSEAYKNASSNFARQRDAAYANARNQAILAGPQNAQQLFSLSSAARSQPLNEFNALRTGSQVQMPSFQGMNPSNAAPTNVMGAYDSAYQGQLNNYNAQMGAYNNTMSGLAGAAGSAAIAGAIFA